MTIHARYTGPAADVFPDATAGRATATASRARLRAGRILSGLGIAFLLWDAVIKLMQIQPVTESFIRLGYPETSALGIGLLELFCVLVHLAPRTRVPGAILLTGFLGGAIATHVRVGDPLLSHVLFPTYIAAFIWGGLFLRAPGLFTVLLQSNDRLEHNGELRCDS